MNIFCIFIIAVLTFCSYIYQKNIYNVSLIFNIFWLIVMIMSSMELFGIYPAEDFVYELVLIGVFFFNVGFLLSNRYHLTTNIFHNINENVIDGRRYFICLLLCLLTLLPDLQMIRFFISSGFDIHYIYYIVAMNSYGGDSIANQFGGGWQQIVMIYIGYPLQYMLIATGICKGVYEKEKQFLIIAILLIMVRFIVDVKRTVILMVFLMAVFFIILLRDKCDVEKIHNKKISTKWLVLMFVFFICIYMALSEARRGEGDEFSLLENLYFYYAGCIKYFELRVLNMDIESTYGFFTLRGLIAPVMGLITKVIGIEFPLYEMASTQLALLHGTIYQIAPGHDYNSYATCFWEFYVDGGVFGIIIFSLLYGYIGGRFYHEYKKRRTLKCMLNLSFFLSVYIMFSMLQISSIINYLVWPLMINFMLFKKECNG